MTPLGIERLEGLAVFIAALSLYGRTGRSWWIYVIAATIPDLCFAAFLFGKRVGSRAYNLVHTFTWPVLLGGLGVARGSTLLIAIGLGWAAHIGADRVLGFRLRDWNFA